MYYISQAFQEAEAKCLCMKKFTFALIVASRKLHPYFQVNPILVMTDQSIKKAMNKPEAVGRMVQWAIELSQFDIEYKPWTAIKAQMLADFITKFTIPEDEEIQNKSALWTIHTNGSSI